MTYQTHQQNLPSCRRIEELEGLRGLAIIMVVIRHASAYFRADSQFGSLLLKTTSLFHISVDIFFALSGFLLGGILIDHINSKRFYSTFYAKRFLRILPLYFALLLSYAIVTRTNLKALYMPDHFTELFNVKYYIFFLQNFLMAKTGDLSPWYLSPCWSLSVEEQFYLFVPLLMRIFFKRNLKLFLVLMIFAAMGIRALIVMFNPFHYPEPSLAVYVLFPCRWDAPFMGVLIACLVRSEEFLSQCRRKIKLLYAALVFFLCEFIILTINAGHPFKAISDIMLYTSSVFFSGLLIIAALADRKRIGAFFRFKLLRRWGRTSYFIYLFQFPVFGLIHGLIFNNRHDLVSDLAVSAVNLLSFILLCFLGHLSWEYFEKKMMVFGRGFSY